MSPQPTFAAGEIRNVHLFMPNDLTPTFKSRPCILLNDFDSRLDETVVVAPLSSSTEETNLVYVRPSEENGLEMDSWVVLNAVASVSASQVDTMAADRFNTSAELLGRVQLLAGVSA